MLEALDYTFFQRALLAGLLASVACGLIGSLVVVKRMASISGGLSHAAFGGVGLGYWLGIDPLLGATVFTLVCGVILASACRRRKQAPDTLIIMTWSIGMALGMIFVSLTPGYAPDLLTYLFGSILFVSAPHVLMLAGLDVLLLAAVVALFKEFQAMAFDEEFSEITGMPVTLLQQVLMALVALTVVGLIRVVGVILVVALLTLPAVVARLWCDSLRGMMAVAMVVGAGCTTAGLFAAYGLSAAGTAQVPSGPLIILMAAAAYLLSTAVHGWCRRRGRRKPAGLPAP